MGRYDNISDEELILKLRAGDQDITDFIMEKYKNLVRKKARAMYLIGGENDDLIQEGMIGLFKAIRDYKEEKEASFFCFAELCISRQIYNAVQASQRKKHTPLNTYISLSFGTNSENEETVSIENIVQSKIDQNPEELFIDKENMFMIEYELENSLSSFEKKVLQLYLTGAGYMQIAEILEKSPKSVDNALQRMKGKLTKILAKKR